ncbi:MAG: diacylglycerol kinase [Alphaproteobacteria bacterium]|nr:diacylglycerol kinase [Alphaproteobacteria bacterium]
MKNTSTGLKRILKAFTYSGKGWVVVCKTEAAFRQDLVIFILGALLCFSLSLSGLERAILLFSLFFILLMELVNSAIEAVIDRISQKYHPLSGKAKDIGSLLVLVAYVNAIVVWLLVLFG